MVPAIGTRTKSGLAATKGRGLHLPAPTMAESAGPFPRNEEPRAAADVAQDVTNR